MNTNKQQDKIRGSLVGGAVGDALGYPVEFINSYEGIQARYGKTGITRYELAENGKALISDDTQMTLFTACGVLNAVKDKSPLIPSICEAYVEWYYTQLGKRKKGFRRWPGENLLGFALMEVRDILRGKIDEESSDISNIMSLMTTKL